MFPSTRSLVPLALWSLFSPTLFSESTALKLQTRTISTSQLSKRGSISGTSNSQGNVPLNDRQNVKYIANITIGGSPFEVMIDSGSSDLWVSGTVKQSHDLNVSAGVQYAVGNAQGNINTANVVFAGHNISNQAFILVKDASSFQPDFLDSGMNGLIGLGPSQGSVVRNTLGNSTGDSVLDRIFNTDKTTPNYISFLLSRNGDPTDVAGELTVGELISGYESISSQPKLPVAALNTDAKNNQHWTIQLDANGIIGPDGKAIKKSSIVPDNNGRLFAVIDSGFTLPQVPRSVSDAIYGRVQGANYSTQYNLWTIPCEQELNISFLIGGVTFPVHPLDTSTTDFNLKDANGKPVCAGTFQPITSAFSLAGQFDLILGMAFLRNTYTLLDFGDFVDGTSSSSVGDPYIQLLSTTVPSKAHSDFVTARLNGVDTTGQSQYTLLPTNKGKTSPVPFDERVQHTEQKAIRYLPEIISCTVGVFLLLIGCCVWRFIRRRRAKRAEDRKFDEIAKLNISAPTNHYDQPHDNSQPIYLQSLGAQSQTFGNKASHDSYHSDYYQKNQADPYNYNYNYQSDPYYR